jgi:hypothetical protein
MHMHIPSHSYCKDVTFFYGTKLTRWTLAGMYSTYYLTNLTRSWCLGFVHCLKVKFTGKPSQFWGKKNGFSEATGGWSSCWSISCQPLSTLGWRGAGDWPHHGGEGRVGKGPERQQWYEKVILLASYCKQFRGFSIHHYGWFPIVVMNWRFLFISVTFIPELDAKICRKLLWKLKQQHH